MFITPMLVMAAMLATPSQTVDNTRAGYTKCLRAFLLESLKAKMPATEFGVAVKGTCATEQAAFHAAVIALDRSSGDSMASAKENADFQVEDYVASFTDKFNDYADSGTLPSEG